MPRPLTQFSVLRLAASQCWWKRPFRTSTFAASFVAALVPMNAGGSALGSEGTLPSHGTVTTRQPKEWRRLIRANAGEVLILVTSADAMIRVKAPQGTFSMEFKTSRELEEWASAAETLPGPQLVGWERRRRNDSLPAVEYSSVQLDPERDTATAKDLTEMFLTRIDSAGPQAFMISGANGAWPFELTLDAVQSSALLASLRGEESDRATTESEQPDEVDESIPETRAKPRRSGRYLEVPPQLSSLTGTVTLSFVIDSTGRVPARSVRLHTKAPRPLVLAVREFVLRSYYWPAELKGRKVAVRARATFSFDDQ